ncbi:MAG: hypothetical protein U0T36_12905 [Saprospiraceae bacterium]|jgi:hypothetical protein
MATKFVNKKFEGNAVYNPALDKFENIDVFPAKTAMVEERLKGRDIKAEIDEALRKERITKP